MSNEWLEWLLIIILVVVLILFDVRRLPELAGRMIESISERAREQRWRRDDFRGWWFCALSFIALVIVLPVLSLDLFSGKQRLAIAVVMLAGVGGWYWSFGRR